MEKKELEKKIQSWTKPIFGFALKHCKDSKDAEDVAQEIVMKCWHAMQNNSEIEDCEKYMWTVAHNTLADYYREKGRRYFNVSVDEMEEYLTDGKDIENTLIADETMKKVLREIAYLSKTQREVLIAYYYEGKNQKEIAREQKLPVGTVKWHLFEAKRNLRRGMETMRNPEELKFNPVRFSLIGFSGCAGEMGGPQAFFQSALPQNIVYSVYREGKTVLQIAEDLNVSPVYVESEAEFLEKYGYLLCRGEKYYANMLLEEEDGNEEKDKLMDTMYADVAHIFAEELYEDLKKSGLLESEELECGYGTDKNYLMWALIPYIAANSGEEAQEKITFEEVATRRIDGAHDISYAIIEGEQPKNIRYYSTMLGWCGPSWVGDGKSILWSCYAKEWCDGSKGEFWKNRPMNKNLKLLCNIKKGEMLSAEEYAVLAEQGLISCSENGAIVNVVRLKSKEIKNQLLALGTKIKSRHKEEFMQKKEPYEKFILAKTPVHLRKARKYGMQYIFRADGWFLIYVIKDLLKSGKLKLPKDTQKKSLMTLVAPEG